MQKNAPPPPRAAKPAAAETTQSDGIDHDLNAVVVVVDIILNVAPSWLLALACSYKSGGGSHHAGEDD
jgi:hypothetical protein